MSEVSLQVPQLRGGSGRSQNHPHGGCSSWARGAKIVKSVAHARWLQRAGVVGIFNLYRFQGKPCKTRLQAVFREISCPVYPAASGCINRSCHLHYVMSLDQINRPGVYFSSVWEDDDLFQVEICASNGRFAGTARCYTTREQIAELARGVDGFPKSTSDAFHFSTHSGDNFSYFGFNFRCVDGRGGVVVRLKVAEIVRFSNSPATDDIVEFEIGVEPASIDKFANELFALAKATIGEKTAILHAKT